MQKIKSLFDKYINEFSREEVRLRQLEGFLQDTVGHQLTDRRNPVGQITASGIVINHDRTKVLLFRHPSLDRWLQPGGHVNPEDQTLLEAAFREIKEEVGIAEEDLQLISPLLDRHVPIDIDTHPIPANPNKQEGQHFHHDFRYLMVYRKPEETLPLNGAEAKEYKWVPISELDVQTTFARLVEKLWHLLSVEFRTKEFYHELITTRYWQFPQAQSVIVAHMIPDCMYYLRAIDQLFPIAAVVPKPNSINSDIFEKVKREFTCTPVDRTTIKLPNNQLTDRLQTCDGKLILFDIGGYFSEIDRHWPGEIVGRVLAVIEDTENGHQKYMARHDYPLPVISAARSPLKDNEDFLVGQSVLFSADSLMRTGGALIQYLKCGVFGYGKIGKSIAFHLQQRDVKPSVYDINPVRRIEAYNRLCSIPDRDEILEASDVLFCATGGQSLGIADFRRLKHGCLVFSVTSSDDEFDLTHLKAEYQFEQVKPYIYKFWNPRNFFFLVNQGNAVNFIHNAVMGPFIHLVRAEMIAATTQRRDSLVVKESNKSVLEVSEEVRARIASLWLKTFDPEHRQISSMEYIL